MPAHTATVAAPPESAEEKPRYGEDVFISRQPVVDSELRVTGYRVAYATREGTAPEDRIRSETTLFGDVLSVVGLQELVGSSLAHMPISKELLLILGFPPVAPDRVMLRIAYGTASDPQAQGVLESLAGRGYALSLHGLPAPDFAAELPDVFGTVELDWVSVDPDARAAAVQSVLERRATPLVGAVRDHLEFEAARDLGVQLFTGPFYSSPRMTAVRNVPVGGMQTLISLARLQGNSASIEELEQVIDRDLGLSVRLLRYINSAYFGTRSSIASIRQAVMMLGARGVSRWALMVSMTGGPTISRELSVMALTRARMCERLGSERGDVGQDELFTVGLLSLADALLDTTMEEILDELPLAEEIASALLRRTGPAGYILDAVVNYENGTFAADSLQAQRGGVAKAYVEALGWAQRTLAEVG